MLSALVTSVNKLVLTSITKKVKSVSNITTLKLENTILGKYISSYNPHASIVGLFQYIGDF